ncbi:hypothetical protein ACPCTG_31620 [Streptomyces pseudogriseolus]|uniref:hypothetical protein n=1 Tax=Streptomyces pseudogriseolus TaxID=36817 RepID=UPI003FA2CB0B
MTAPVAPANRIVVLLAELIPSRPETTPVRGPWTKAEQDAHWNALCDAVGTPGAPRPPTKTAAA